MSEPVGGCGAGEARLPCGCGNEEFSSLLDRFLSEQFTDWPVMASSAGVEARDAQLGDFSAEAFARRDDEEECWRRRFDAIAPSRLGRDERIDRELVLAALRGSAVMREWGAWRRNPDVYLQPPFQGVLTLFLHRRRPEGRLAEAAAARLEAVADVLEHGRANLDPVLASPVLAARAAAQCRSAADFVGRLLPGELREPRLRERVARAGVRASRAYARFARFLDQLRADASGSFAIGQERYDRLLRDQELLGYDTIALREQGRAAYEELRAELERAASRRRLGGGWRALVAELRRDCPTSEQEMADLYARWTERAREFVIDRGLALVPSDERCQVEPAPAFYRPMLAVPFHSGLPAFGSSRLGHMFLPFAPDEASPAERRDRLRFNSRCAVPSICVHESYPGHHWHGLAVQSNPRPARKVFTSSFFVEGWAVYAESMMGEEGFYTDPRQELARISGRMFRAVRVVVDTSLHLGDMGFEEGVAFLVENGGVPPSAARLEVARYCSWPTQASAYLVGALEIERLRARYLNCGTGSLLAFHQAICGSGALPLPLAGRALEHAQPART